MGVLMVKVILQVYPTLRAESEEERRRLRPIGRNVERYQAAFQGTFDIARACDRLGVWGLSTIEHHFHSEGYEVAPNPGLLNAYWAAITEKVRIGQLGYTMSAQNPIRVAEDTAILSHMTRGRSFVGFSRGYQSRWTDVLAQHYGTGATASDGGEDDETNRRVFEEHVQMVIDAWTNDSIEHKSDNWQIPFPHAGHEGWPMTATQDLGAPGEMDEQGLLRRSSVVPSPYNQPHPPVFVASNVSAETVAYAGRMGFIPSYFTGIARVQAGAELYVESARSVGRDVVLGQKQALVRWPQIADTTAEAREAVREYDVEIFKNFYSAFLPKRSDGSPMVSAGATDDEVIDVIDSSGLWAHGSVSEVRDQFVAQWKDVPAEYVVLITHYAQMPTDVVIRNLELFMSEVKPALDEITPYETDD